MSKITGGSILMQVGRLKDFDQTFTSKPKISDELSVKAKTLKEIFYKRMISRIVHQSVEKFIGRELEVKEMLLIDEMVEKVNTNFDDYKVQ